MHQDRLHLKRDGKRAEPDFVSRRNGRVPLNRLGRQYSRLLPDEACASAVIMLDTQFSEIVWRVLATHSIRQFPFTSPPVRHCVPSHFNWTLSNLFYFGMTLYMFRTVFPSIIKSSRLYIQQQAFVKRILLASRQQYLFDKCLLLYVQSWTLDDGRKDRPKHVQCHSKIK